MDISFVGCRLSCCDQCWCSHGSAASFARNCSSGHPGLFDGSCAPRARLHILPVLPQHQSEGGWARPLDASTPGPQVSTIPKTGNRSSGSFARGRCHHVGARQPDEAAVHGRAHVARGGARPPLGHEPESRSHRHVPAAQPHGVSQRDPRSRSRSRSMWRRCYRATRRASASTTSLSEICRRRCSRAMSRRRRRSAGWRWAVRAFRSAVRPFGSNPTSRRRNTSRGFQSGPAAARWFRTRFRSTASTKSRFDWRETATSTSKVCSSRHEIELLLDGERVRLFTIEPLALTKNEPGERFAVAREPGQPSQDPRLPVTAGPHALGVTFPKKPSLLLETGRQPYEAHFNYYRHPRLQPAVYEISIVGPYNAGRRGRHAQPPAGFHVPADVTEKRGRVREENPLRR